MTLAGRVLGSAALPAPAAALGVSLASGPPLEEVAQGQAVGQSLGRRQREWKTGAGAQLGRKAEGGGVKGVPPFPSPPCGAGSAAVALSSSLFQPKSLSSTKSLGISRGLQKIHGKTTSMAPASIPKASIHQGSGETDPCCKRKFTITTQVVTGKQNSLACCTQNVNSPGWGTR